MRNVNNYQESFQDFFIKVNCRMCVISTEKMKQQQNPHYTKTNTVEYTVIFSSSRN